MHPTLTFEGIFGDASDLDAEAIVSLTTCIDKVGEATSYIAKPVKLGDKVVGMITDCVPTDDDHYELTLTVSTTCMKEEK